MSASLFEQILARVEFVLDSLVSATVERGREDALADDELPGINIRRGESGGESFGDRERHLFDFFLEIDVKGGETVADALHMAANNALQSDAELPRMASGLRCTRTEIQTSSSDAVRSKLTAHYRVQTLMRAGDYTRSAF